MRYPVFLNRYRWFGKARRGCETAPAPISRKARAQWPGRNRKPPLRFCVPELFCLTQGVTPVNGVRGKANMSTKCSSGAVPGGKIPSAHNKRNPKPVPSSVMASPCHLPPRGKAYGRLIAAPTKFRGSFRFYRRGRRPRRPAGAHCAPIQANRNVSGRAGEGTRPYGVSEGAFIFCRARCPHRAVPGRPGVPPLRNKRKYT